MLDIKDFSVFEDQASFDFKGLLIKLKLLEMVSLIITFTIAYQVNIRKGKVYSMETLICKGRKQPCLRQIRVLLT
jgi:hypothetical protein